MALKSREFLPDTQDVPHSSGPRAVTPLLQYTPRTPLNMRTRAKEGSIVTTDASIGTSRITNFPGRSRPPVPPAQQPVSIDRYRVPDELWAKIQPAVLRMDPPKTLGRKRIEPRAALDAIIFRMLTRCPWNRLPDAFPDDSAIHRTYQRWKSAGLLNEIWTILLAEQRGTARDEQPHSQAG